MNDDDNEYNAAELARLWKLSYKELAMVPGEPGARLREARFIMQAKVALETRRLQFVIAVATVVMTIATVVLAIKG
jgi:hypothetical protein